MRRLASTRLRAPSLPPTVVLPITIVFAILTFIRGADWLLIHRPGTISAVMLENGAGLRFWGATLMVGAVALVAGYCIRRHFPVWCAHVFLVSAYFGIAVTTVQVVIAYGAGVQNLVAPIGGVIWHGVLSRLMRPLPPHTGGPGAH